MCVCVRERQRERERERERTRWCRIGPKKIKFDKNFKPLLRISFMTWSLAVEGFFSLDDSSDTQLRSSFQATNVWKTSDGEIIEIRIVFVSRMSQNIQPPRNSLKLR